jgi:hypothetical protein
VDPSALGIRRIILSGGHTSEAWLASLAAEWSVEIYCRYGYYEGIGGATLCRHCDRYYFDPFLIPEIDSCSGPAYVSERGVLLVTELYPFAQLQPLIRYAAGDLFEWARTECHQCRCRGFRFLGRFENALLDPRTGRIIIYPRELYDELECFPELERAPRTNIPESDWNRDVGELLGNLEIESANSLPMLKLQLVPRFVPHSFPEAADLLKQRLTQRILKANLALSSGVRNGDLAFSIDLCGKRSVETRLSFR